MGKPLRTQHNRIVGNNLEKIMTRRNLGQKPLADMIGVPPNTVWRYCDKRQAMFLETGGQIAQALRVSIDALAYPKTLDFNPVCPDCKSYILSHSKLKMSEGIFTEYKCSDCGFIFLVKSDRNKR